MFQLILKAIQNNSPITYSDLEARAVKRGLSLDELDDLLIRVHKDKRVKKTVKDDEIVYNWQEPKVKDPTPHLTWLRENYPRPMKCTHGLEQTSCSVCRPFPSIDMSWIVLSPDEMVEYKEQLNGGRPKYGKARKQNPTRHN